MPGRLKAWLGIGIAVSLFLAGTAAAGPAAGQPAPGPATFTVNTTNDAAADFTNDGNYTVCQTAPNNGFCSLRAAIMNANRHAGGAVSTIVDGGGTDDVFFVHPGAGLTLTGVTIRHGAAVFGGGVFSQGQLSLADSIITSNTAGSAGGGLWVAGTTALTNVTIASNHAATLGGGFYNSGQMGLTHITIEGNSSAGDGGGIATSAALTLTDSAVDNNHAGGAGGGLLNSGSLTVFNSTISNNSSGFDGGGVENNGTARFFHTTVAGNLADPVAAGGYIGGGLSSAGTTQAWNTLFADNYVSNTASNCAGNPLTSEDHNYFEMEAGCTIVRGPTITHDVTGGDPLLAALDDNGGATQTRALLAGSPSLDQIPPAVCRDPSGAAPVPDQRGVARPVNGLCDIGAFEGQQPLIGYLRNLVRNGDAEAAAGSPDGAFVGVPDWGSGGGQLLTVARYNAGGFPTVPTDTVPAIHGHNLFAGGDSAVAVGTQNIDLTPLAASLDTGNVSYDFSADLGGFDDQGDNATVEADFLDQTFHLLSRVILGPVTAFDRNHQTGLLHRDATDQVPKTTRSVSLFINLTLTNGPYNDGYADNISLVLLPKAAIFLPALRR